MPQTLCIVGLGYVGLPLARAFAKAKFEVIGFDVNEERIGELEAGKDRTNELSSEQLSGIAIEFSADPSVIKKAEIVILAIPTPVDADNKPDLTLLEKATETVAENMSDGAIVVFESTAYPGVTEELCKDILKKSGKNFKLGYSPERVNPGDKEHTIEKIVKVVAGEDEETTDTLCELYGTIIKAGVHRAPSIKVAEMAKAIENAQRDLNIAYVNEIAKLCDKLGIQTKDVLEAAGTKWNFLPFVPGLVGGHCIGVDPYYLLEKAKSLDEEMPIITASRKTNDEMPRIVADQVLSKLEKADAASVLVLGMTFKEDVPDNRNSKSPDVIKHLEAAGCKVTSHDPYLANGDLSGSYDAILLLVPHREYMEMAPKDFAALANEGCVFYDLKSVFKKEDIENTGMEYASL